MAGSPVGSPGPPTVYSNVAETIVAPGHGCLTTVAYERAHNPFFG